MYESTSCSNFCFSFCNNILFEGTESKAESLDQWDLTKEYTLEQDSVKYYAYLTKDKKESWIYTAEVLDKEKMLDVVFPKEVEGAPVVCLGYSQELYGAKHQDESFLDFGITLFGNITEPWHGGGPIKKNIRSVIIPDTVKDLEGISLAYMDDLQYVHLPAQLTRLENWMFSGDKKLKKIDFPQKVKVIGGDVFEDCKSLRGLMHESKRLANDTLTFSGNMVINQTEKTLIQVMPDEKKITIPANVKWIEPTAFQNCSLQTVKVAKKNKSFAVHKRCLYRKKEGQLVLVFGKGSTVTLSKKIKEIGEDVATAKYKIKKLIIPKKMERYDNWKKPYVTNNKKVKIYYCGKRIR